MGCSSGCALAALVPLLSTPLISGFMDKNIHCIINSASSNSKTDVTLAMLHGVWLWKFITKLDDPRKTDKRHYYCACVHTHCTHASSNSKTEVTLAMLYGVWLWKFITKLDDPGKTDKRHYYCACAHTGCTHQSTGSTCWTIRGSPSRQPDCNQFALWCVLEKFHLVKILFVCYKGSVLCCHFPFAWQIESIFAKFPIDQLGRHAEQ